MATKKDQSKAAIGREKPVKQAKALRCDDYNIVAVVQAGRLQYEAILLAASLRQWPLDHLPAVAQ